MTPAIEFIRMANVALLILTLAVLGGRVTRWWCSRWLCLVPAIGTGAIALFVAGSNVDALLHNRPGGLGTFLITVASTALLMQACTVGMGRSHPRGLDHPTGGAYLAFDPAKGAPACGPDDPSC